mgnify:FL=1
MGITNNKHWSAHNYLCVYFKFLLNFVVELRNITYICVTKHINY